MHKILTSQIIIIVVSVLFSFALVFGVGFLALGISGDPSNRQMDNQVMNVIYTIRPYEAEVDKNYASFPTNQAYQQAQSEAQSKDYIHGLIYAFGLYLIISLVYFPIYIKKYKNQPLPQPPTN